MTPSTNTSWETLFARHHIAEHVAQYGSFRIDAREINTVREARLMAKFDVAQSLPAIFRHHQLSILPISRGSYVIGPFEAYQRIDYQRFPIARPLSIPHLDTLDSSDIHSEAEAIRVLQLSGALHEVCAARELYPTLQGRRGSGQFDFTIACTGQPPQQITVNNAQIEIDAGFETATHVYICEAKNQLVHDLLVRQLYYPYRFVAQRSRKTIVPISIIYNNFTFYITRYTVSNPHDYNSLVSTTCYSYTLDTQPFHMADVVDVWQRSTPHIITHIPFPQADEIRIVLNVVRILQQGATTKASITEVLGYDIRQTDYYVNAARWLGFIDERMGLTAIGQQIMHATPHQQKRLVIRAIFATPFFYAMGKLLIDRHAVPDRDDIIAALAHDPELCTQMSGTTRSRRAQTVHAWLRWIMQQLTVAATHDIG